MKRINQNLADMTKDVLGTYLFGQVALKKMEPVSENFRLYYAGWTDEEFAVMKVIGCEFKVASSGLYKGKMSIQVPGTTKIEYITKKEMEEFKNEQGYHSAP